jgi:hypothetical protein
MSTCPQCGSETRAYPGKGPHAALLRCIRCSWSKWLSRVDAQSFVIHPEPEKSRSDLSQGMLF